MESCFVKRIFKHLRQKINFHREYKHLSRVFQLRFESRQWENYSNLNSKLIYLSLSSFVIFVTRVTLLKDGRVKTLIFLKIFKQFSYSYFIKRTTNDETHDA